MTLADLVGYLEHRFPKDSEILDVQISMICDEKSGIIETITMLGDESDDLDDGEREDGKDHKSKQKLRVVS